MILALLFSFVQIKNSETIVKRKKEIMNQAYGGRCVEKSEQIQT